MESQHELQKLLARIHQEVLSGLRHGFFEYSVIGEIKNGKRHVTVKARKSHKFTLSSKDIQETERELQRNDFCEGSVGVNDFIRLLPLQRRDKR